MNKKFLAFIIAFPAMLLLFIFKIIPAISSLIISLKDYVVYKGIFGSPWVGGRNYSEFFKSQAFTAILRNTLVLSTLSIVLTCVLAALLVICISKLPGKWWKLVSVIIIALPAFIPISSYTSVFLKALYSDTGTIHWFFMTFGIESKSIFTDPAYYPVLFAIMDSLRNIFVPVIIGVLVCDTGKNTDYRKIVPVMTGYILIRATMLLSPDIETILTSYNPMVYRSADVFDAYLYRNGLLQNNISLGNTVWVVKTAAQILINTVLYFLLTGLLRDKTEIQDKISDRVNRGMGSIISIVGYLLLAAGSIAVIWFIIPAPDRLINGTRMLLNNDRFIPSIFNSLTYGIISCIIYGFITISLAYPLAFKTRLYPFILIVIMSLTNNTIGEYIFLGSAGMVNTIFPIIINSSLSVMGAFALHFTVVNKLKDHTSGFGEYVTISILPLISIVILFFIVNWGGYLNQQIYLHDRSLYGIGLFGREITFIKGGTDLESQTALESIRSAYIFISSIAPILLGTILICLNKYLPLKAFSVQSRKG